MKVFVPLAIAAVLALPAAAQTPLASIRGVVLDPSAMPIPGVQVAIVQFDTGEVFDPRNPRNPRHEGLYDPRQSAESAA